MEFYIRETDHPDGPYDLMAAIRKIRNGTLKAGTPVSLEYDGEIMLAQSVPELTTFFEEESVQPAHAFVAKRAKTFPELIGVGMEFLRNSISATIYSGLFMVLWLMVAYIFIFNGSVVQAVIGITLSYFLLGGYLYGIMRYVRGNPIDAKMITSVMSRSLLPMGIVSVIVGMLMLPGLVLTHYVLSETGLFISLPLQFIFLFVVLTFFAFAPLLIIEKGADFMDALRDSARFVRKGNNMGIVFALVTLNFILLPLLPIVLPVTMGALVEMYDEHFD